MIQIPFFWKLIIFYYSGINFILFFMMLLDKHKAKKNKWRIPENNLFITAFVGGGLGGFIGMFLFHHKNRKLKFILLYTFSILLHSALLWFLYTHLPF